MRLAINRTHVPRLLPSLPAGHTARFLATQLWIASAAIAHAAPVIINQPFTAKPGDVISLTGSGFGSSPQVIFKARRQEAAAPVKIVHASEKALAIEIPKTQPFDVYDIAISDGTAVTPAVAVNLPRAMHFDTPEIASNDTFRIFGRNLYAAPASPSVTLVDTVTGAQLPATIDLAASDAYSLTVAAPGGIVAGHPYTVVVSNGYGSARADKSIQGRSAEGGDSFRLAVPWGRDFISEDGQHYNGTADNASHHVYNVKTDPFLKRHASGDGVSDDRPAIQAAIDAAAAHGGGLVFLPEGTYHLSAAANGSAIRMAPGVVLQGHGPSHTKIVWGATPRAMSA